jgi:hypothetical protein
VINTIFDQKSSTILIAGAGQLGSRYLQGLTGCHNTLDIYVQDISKQSLKIAKQRWEEVCLTTEAVTGGLTDPSYQNQITFVSSFEKLPKQIDFAIVATNADVRPQVVKQITAKCDVQFWILEKILAQSVTALDDLFTHTQNSTGAWANIPRRMMTWHQEIREKLQSDTPLHITGSGSLWGLACNGIHYIDLVSWWTDEKLKTIDTSKLDSKWIKSKRKGFFEVTGKITAVYTGGTILVLESRLEGYPFKMKVEGKNSVWEIDEIKGIAVGSDGIIITGNNETQSSMTSKLVDDILAGNNCELPKLCDSVEMHRIFLCSLLEHWNNVNSRNDDTLSIT